MDCQLTLIRLLNAVSNVGVFMKVGGWSGYTVCDTVGEYDEALPQEFSGRTLNVT